MDIVTSVPVHIRPTDTIEPFLREVHERVTRRAYQNFVDRGGLPGHDLDDWLEAERELVIKVAPEVFVAGQDIIIEVTLPEIDFPNVAVHPAARQLVISSEIHETGLQVCQVIELPVEISMEGIDAEQLGHSVRITAALA
jgi:DUF2934 family protein